MDYSVSCGNIKEKTNTRDNMKKEITGWDRQFMWGIVNYQAKTTVLDHTEPLMQAQGLGYYRW